METVRNCDTKFIPLMERSGEMCSCGEIGGRRRDGEIDAQIKIYFEKDPFLGQ